MSITAADDRALRQHRARQQEMRLTAGPAWQDHELIFASAVGCPPDLRSLVRHHFKKIVERSGVPAIRLYDLRHSHVSLLLAKGVPVHTISSRVGHSSAKMTLDVYSHVTAAQGDAVADTMAAALG